MTADLFSRILVPLDGSTLAESAVDAACELASQNHGEVVLATISDQTVVHGFEAFAAAERVSPIEAIRQYLEATAASLRERGIKARTLMGDDPDAAVGLIELAAADGASSIVITTHGRTGIGRWFLGSVAEKVVRGAPCAVLVIRSEAS
jgi:nucleotide-binding universal stress UspA family protein